MLIELFILIVVVAGGRHRATTATEISKGTSD